MTYNFETVQCNLCGADNFQAISNKGKNGLPTNVVLCKNCGLGYLNPRWDAESYMSFYRDEYDVHYRPKILKTETYNKSEKNPIEERLRSLGHLPASVEYILDIGSGEGKNTKHFAYLFPNSTLLAIEPSTESQRQLKEFGVTTISEDVSKDWEVDYVNQIDLIIMRHVLEHFMNPLEAMIKIRKSLSDNGIIYIAVPNNLKPNQDLESSWFRNVHTYYFNKFSLKNLMTMAGLEIMDMVEGDLFNQHEIYLIVRKCETPLQPQYSAEHFAIQLSVFQNKLKEDKNFFKNIFHKLKRKITI